MANGRVHELLSWLQGMLQRSLRQILGPYQVLVISGHIGLPSVVQQLGLSDRINYLYTFRLGPWSRDASIACFHIKILAEATCSTHSPRIHGAVLTGCTRHGSTISRSVLPLCLMSWSMMVILNLTTMDTGLLQNC